MKMKWYRGLVVGLLCVVAVWQTPLMVHATEADVPQASEAEQIYKLKTPFQGDGNSAFVDTGIKLYDGSMEDWIVIACLSNDLGSGDNVFFSCFSEEEPYRGLLLRNPTTESYEFICGERGQTWSYWEDATYFTVAIQKTENHYMIMYNGEILYELESEEIDSYDGNLLIGCEEDPQGKKFRFGDVMVAGLEVYEGTQSPSLTAARMEVLAEEAKELETDRQGRVLVNREEQYRELTPFEILLETLRENGRVLLLLAVGFIFSCIAVYRFERNKRNRGDQ